MSIPVSSLSRNLKSRVNWNLDKNDIPAIVWKDSYRADCPVSALISKLMCTVNERAFSQTIKEDSEYKSWFTAESIVAFWNKLIACHLCSSNCSGVS